MVLTAAQKKAVAAAKSSDRSALRTRFNAQNSGNRGNANRGRGRGRGNFRGRGNTRGRGRGRNSRSRGRNVSAPTARGHYVERQQTTTMRQVQTYYIKTFDIPTQPLPVTAQVVDITPANLPWLDQFSLLYGRYQIQKFMYRFVTASPTTTSGSVWAAYQAISTPNLPTTLNQLQQLSQHKIGPVYNTWSVFASVPPHLLKERWFRTTDIPQDGQGTLPDFADRIPGRILFGTVGVAPDVNGGILGYLEVHVDVIFGDPHTISFGSNPIKQPQPIPDIDGISLLIQVKLNEPEVQVLAKACNINLFEPLDLINLDGIGVNGKKFAFQCESVRGTHNLPDEGSVEITLINTDGVENVFNVAGFRAIADDVDQTTFEMRLFGGGKQRSIRTASASALLSDEIPNDPNLNPIDEDFSYFCEEEEEELVFPELELEEDPMKILMNQLNNLTMEVKSLRQQRKESDENYSLISFDE